MYFFEQLIYEKDPPVIYEQEIPQQAQVVDPRQQALQQQKVAQEQQAQAEQQALQQQSTVPPTQLQTPEQQQYWSQYQNPQDQQQEIDPTQADSSADVLNSPASISIKRYFLIKKMFALNEKLNRLNMENDVLNFIINFIDSFSYEALLSITRRLVEEIYEKVKSQEQVKPKLEENLSIS